MTGLMLIHLFGYMADRIVGLGGPNGRRSQHCGKGRRSPLMLAPHLRIAALQGPMLRPERGRRSLLDIV